MSTYTHFFFFFKRYKTRTAKTRCQSASASSASALALLVTLLHSRRHENKRQEERMVCVNHTKLTFSQSEIRSTIHHLCADAVVFLIWRDQQCSPISHIVQWASTSDHTTSLNIRLSLTSSFKHSAFILHTNMHINLNKTATFYIYRMLSLKVYWQFTTITWKFINLKSKKN